MYVPGEQSQTSGLCHIGDVLPCSSLHWVSKELLLFSASAKDLSALQLSHNEIGRRGKGLFGKIGLFD